MLVVFECTVVFQRIKTIGEFRGMGQKPYTVFVKRQKKWIQVQSDELLPGDLVSIGKYLVVWICDCWRNWSFNTIFSSVL